MWRLGWQVPSRTGKFRGMEPAKICGDRIEFDDIAVSCDKRAGHPGCHASLSVDPDDVAEWSNHSDGLTRVRRAPRRDGSRDRGSNPKRVDR